MLPGLQKLQLAPCPTGMEAMDVEGDESWERRVRQRVAAMQVTSPDLAPDLVVVVLAAIDTGDAKNACRAVSAWCGTNHNHRQACLDAGPVFAALSAAIFTPMAPTLVPATAHMPILVPNDARANFNALCNRIADYKAGRVMLQANTPDTRIHPFVHAAVQFNPVAALPNVWPNFYTNRELMKRAIKQDGMALQFAYFHDLAMCRIAVAQNGLALQFVINHWRRERTSVTLAAVRQNGLALQYALPPASLVDTVLYAAVRQNGNALQYASDRRRGDYDLVMEAVKNKGSALRWADELRQDDPEIVRAAVSNDGSAIEYASPRLQGDPEIRAAAAAQIRYGVSAEGSASVVVF